MKTKLLLAGDRRASILRGNEPNFHRSGSIAGMKRLFYGENARLIRCGSYIYNCVSPRAKALYDSLP